VNRLAIFFHYDADGEISSFVYEYLRSLRTVAKHIVFVNNGQLSPESLQKTSAIADDCFTRENIGFDSWAYKHALERLGWGVVRTFDDVILCNFTCYAPAGNLREMFDEMKTRGCDFWGIAKHPECDHYLIPSRKLGYIYEHIMSYFMVFSHTVIQSEKFSDYWTNLPQITNYAEAVGYHETVLTKYLEDCGFKSDAFVDLQETQSVSSNASVYQADDFLEIFNCPIVKRKAFFHDYSDLLVQSTVRQGSNLLRHMERSGCFNTQLIWDDLLRTQDAYTLMKSLHLQFMLSNDQNGDGESTSRRHTACSVVIHVASEAVALFFTRYFRGTATHASIFIEFADAEMEGKYSDAFRQIFGASAVILSRHVEEGHTPTEWYDSFSRAVMRIDRNELLCFVSLPEPPPETVWLLSAYANYKDILESLMGNRSTEDRISEIFASNERLGLLIPLPATHADFHPEGMPLPEATLGRILSLTKTLQLRNSFGSRDVTVQFYKPARCLWLRGGALRSDDINKVISSHSNPLEISLIIQSLLPAFVQSSGFYTATIATERQYFAHLDNLRHKYGVLYKPLNVLPPKIDLLTSEMTTFSIKQARKKHILRAFVHYLRDFLRSIRKRLRSIRGEI
jgi:rhamnosyltransferase